MDCTITRDTLSAYWDDELAGPERDRVREHIASCSACLRELDVLKKGTGRLRALRARKAPPTIAQGVRVEIQRLRRTWLRAAAAALALFVIAGALIRISTAAPVEKAAATLPPAAPTPVLLIAADDLGTVREEVHGLLEAFHAPVQTGAVELGDDPALKDSCVTTYLTEAERDALERHIDRLAGRATRINDAPAERGLRKRVILKFEEAPPTE